MPFYQSPREVIGLTEKGVRRTARLDLRETVFNLPAQSVIAKDKVSINIDALLYIQGTVRNAPRTRLRISLVQ